MQLVRAQIVVRPFESVGNMDDRSCLAAMLHRAGYFARSSEAVMTVRITYSYQYPNGHWIDLVFRPTSLAHAIRVARQIHHMPRVYYVCIEVFTESPMHWPAPVRMLEFHPSLRDAVLSHFP